MDFPLESSSSVPLRPASTSRRAQERPAEKNPVGDRESQTLAQNPQTGFLFVDAQTDDPRNRALQKEKQVFVLNKYFRKRREAAIERVKPSKPLPSSSSRQRLEKQHTAESDEHALRNRRRDCHAVAQCAAAASQMHSLTTYLSQGYTDPFSSSVVEMTDPRYSYMYHFRVHTIPACYPLDATRISTYWWRQAITQPALLQALMFLAAGHQASLQLSSGCPSQELAFKSLRDSLRSRGDSLRLLQEIIQDPAWAVAESTGLAIATLVTIEAVNANFTAVEAHMKGLQRLVGLFGGLERANHMFLSKIYLSDVKAAALTNTRPIFPIVPQWQNAILQHATLFIAREHPELELTLMAPTNTSTPSLGSAIFSAPWYSGLATSMRTFLRVFARLTAYYEVAVPNPALVMDTDNDLYILLEHQLLDARYCPATLNAGARLPGTECGGGYIDDTDSHSLLNEPLRLTLLIYLMTRMWHLQPFSAMEYVTKTLRDALSLETAFLEVDPDRDTALEPDVSTTPVTTLHHIKTIAPDLVLWILFVGATASRGYTSRAWFVEQLAGSVWELGLREWDEARRVLGKFFWSDQDCFQCDEDVVWTEVTDRFGDNSGHVC
ncbi:hypothetical protein BJY01DRAFT_248065 [Aspergillus pseudoustus]|uniref:Fungal-specific transcription factor domain-containing protein n=1 Tax=Aspergillus pseudoustus TaxID=1810923 RepID=A0ABR4JWX1_9EURO